MTNWKVGDFVRVIERGDVVYTAIILKVTKTRVTTAVHLGGALCSSDRTQWKLNGAGYGQGIYNHRRIQPVTVTL